MPQQTPQNIQQHIDKKAVAESFSKAASHYDQFAQLQRDIGDELLNCLITCSEANKLTIDKMVDLGCGTGYFSEKLTHHFPGVSLTCFDLSTAMLEQVKKRNINHVIFQQGDIDNLPFTKNSQDLIFSNLVVQWSDNLTHCLEQIKNSLKKGGKAYLSTLLSGSLNELTQAWKRVDSFPHTNSFLTLQEIQEVVKYSGFSSVNIKTETRILAYDNVIEVMRALKGIGANHVHGHQAQQTTGRQLIKQLEQGYQAFTNENGLVTLTYQVCYIEVTK